MRRRAFLAGGALLAGAGCVAPSVGGEPLSVLKWAPRNRRVLMDLIRNAPRGTRPYAVFDWDNTCVFGDCEDTLLAFQLETFSFAMPPEAFSRVIRQGVPPGVFGAGFVSLEGRPVRFQDLADDMVRDYAELWHQYGGWSADRAAVPAGTPALAALRARVLFCYDAIGKTVGPQVSLYWIVRLLCGFTRLQVEGLAGQANRWALNREIGFFTQRVPDGRNGRSGRVQYVAWQGLRLTPEIADLQGVLQRSGIDVFVCSASLEDVVRVFATDPAFGYGVPADHVLGLRMEWPSGVLGAEAVAGWPATFQAGKGEAIRQALVRERGCGPLLVCGDSEGDVVMQTAFSDTRVSLIVNRLARGGEGDLSRKAAASLSSERPRFLLQGRDETTGEWRPSEETLAFGERVPRLLASS